MDDRERTAAPPTGYLVVHAMDRSDWVSGDDPLRPTSLAEEGFIHLSTPQQIAGVCTALYADRHDLVLLVVDPNRLPSPLVWEDCYEAGQEFPHLYDALPRSAVVDVLDYAPDPDGTFPAPQIAT